MTKRELRFPFVLLAVLFAAVTRNLIVNADDLGLTEGVNLAVLECRRRGVLTSATLMANVPAFSGGVATAKELERDGALPAFSVGCHVILIDGEPLLPPNEIPTLVGADGRFRHKLSQFAQDALRSRICVEDIEREASAQIGRLQAAGISVSHLDTHKHAHMFPAVLDGVLLAARKQGVRAVRNPFEQPFAIAGAMAGRPALWFRYAQVQFLRRWRAQFVSSVRDAGLVTTDGCLGVTITGAMNEALLAETLKNMPEGTWELVCHPGYNDPDLQSAGTRLLASRGTEMELLNSARMRELLQREGIELISFRNL